MYFTENIKKVLNFDTCCIIFLSLRQKIADVYLSMTSNASCEQLEEGKKKIPKAVSHSILYNKVTMKTIWLTFYKNYLIKQIDSMLPCAKKTSKYGDTPGCCFRVLNWNSRETYKRGKLARRPLGLRERKFDFLAHGDLLLVILHGRQGDSVLVPQ